MFSARLDGQASSNSANEMGKAPISRRKRKTLSCYECRRRKLRCDREEPSCGRCRNAGQGDSCSYEQKPTSKNRDHASATSPSASPSISTSARRWWTPATSHGAAPTNGSEPVNPTVVSTARNLGEDITTQAPLVTAQNSGSWQLLYTVSSANELRPAIRPDSNAPSVFSPHKPTTPEAVIFRGENFKTHYYGSSNPISLISHFPELRSFMRETIMNRSSLPRVQRELKSFQARWKGVKSGISLVADFDFLCLLPDKATVDHHVQLYFETVETVYRIIHYPSFLEEYESFWTDQRAAKPAFVILLLMIMASVSCIASKEQPKYIGDSSATRERAVLFIEVSEWWLSRHSHKHIYLAIWQIRCLLLLAKQVNNVKKKRHWAEAGHLIREAMSAGFHRDLNLFGDRVSFFDQEMRRRLWATMLELELQTSIDRGMPSAAVGISSDSAAALNINDEDLTLDCDHLPTSKPLSQFTTCSFLHLSATSLPLRVSVNSLANDIASRSRYEEVLNYEERILKELEKLPKWTDSRSATTQDKDSNMAHLLLDVQLRQFLILLHAPFARQTDATNPRFSLSRMVCLTAACEIIDKHSELAKSGNHLLLLFRHDYFRGALAICHNMYTSLSLQNNVVFGLNSKMLLQYLDRVLVMLEERISYLGTGYTHYWYICAASALLRSILDPADSKAQMEEAIGRLIRQYHRTLAGQEETRQAERNLIPTELRRTNLPTDQSQFSADISNGVGFGGFGEEFSQIAFDGTDVPLDEFFFGNPAAWTFENLWSNK